MPERAEFSEFTYGFALTREFLRRGGGVTGAPVLPNQRDEGKPGGGYDVMLGFRRAKALFLQFKLAERVKHPLGGQWSLFGRPYLRFEIRPSSESKQHELLVDLTRRGRVAYAAPEFLSSKELNSAFMSRQVIARSALFAVEDIGPIRDRDWHCVAYTPASAHGWFCSEPLQIPNHGGERTESYMRDISSDQRIPDITAENAGEIALSLEADAYEILGQERQTSERIDSESGSDRLARVASVFYGVHLVLVEAPTVPAGS